MCGASWQATVLGPGKSSCTSLDGLPAGSARAQALLPSSSRAAKETLPTGVRFMDYSSGFA